MRIHSKDIGGLTVSEVLVTSGILLMLFAAITAIYVSSSRVWRKVDLRTSLLRELTAAVRHLERDLEVTHPHGIARADNACAYLSATNDDWRPTVGPDGRLNWQKYVIVFVDPEGRLRRRILPLGTPSVRPPSFREETSYALKDYLSGPLDNDRYLTHSGKVTRFELANAGHYGSLYELSIEGEQPKNSTEVEKLEIRTKVSVRF